jgi:hypothetical protein
LNRLALALQIGFLRLTGRTLNSVELIPPQILDHLGRQVDCAAPRIASIRAFYRRRHRTLFEHHASALRLLGRSELTPHAERGLVAYLRREAAAVFDDAELMARARSWLVEHDYLLVRERHIRRLTIAARRHQQQALFKLIMAMPVERDLWVPRLLAPIEEDGISRREWLDAVPSSRSAQGLAEQMEKISFLKELGADRLALPELPLAGLEYFARRMISRKPAALTRIKDPHRTIEVEIRGFVRRLVGALRSHWPKVEILLRADSHYASPAGSREREFRARGTGQCVGRFPASNSTNASRQGARDPGCRFSRPKSADKR